MKDLHRLVYTSARQKNCNDAEIEKILASCKKNNVGLDITGMLIHTDRRFLQIVEGKKDVIVKLYEKIKNDHRHGGVNLRYLEPVSERAFPDWHMAYKDISSDKVDFMTNISDEIKESIQSMLDGDITSYQDRGMRFLKTFLLTS